MNGKEPVEVWTAVEASRFLRLHPKTVYDMLADGTLPAKRIGRTWRIRRSAVEALLDPGPVETAPAETTTG